MNKKVCLLAILIFTYLLIESYINHNIVFIIFYFIGIIMLILSLIWESKFSKADPQKVVVPYMNFALLYWILGSEIKNYIKYMEKDAELITILYAEGILVFSVLTIYEYIRFFGNRNKKSSKWLYGTVIALELIKILIVIIVE